MGRRHLELQAAHGVPFRFTDISSMEGMYEVRFKINLTLSLLATVLPATANFWMMP